MILRSYFRTLTSFKANCMRLFSTGGLDDYEFSEKTKEILKKRGFTNLMPIQREMFKPIFEGQNVVGQDVTGSGKTLAYIIPIMESLRKQHLIPKRKPANPYVLTLTPTRELVVQVWLIITFRLFKNSMDCCIIVRSIMYNQCSEDYHSKE